jgi:hypothetical protein
MESRFAASLNDFCNKIGIMPTRLFNPDQSGRRLKETAAL